MPKERIPEVKEADEVVIEFDDSVKRKEMRPKDMKGCLGSAFDNWRQVDNVMKYLTGLIVMPERKNASSINRSFADYKNQASANNLTTDST